MYRIGELSSCLYFNISEVGLDNLMFISLIINVMAVVFCAWEELNIFVFRE